MKTISCTDVIFARVTRCGQTLASLSLSGITSLQQLYMRIRTQLGTRLGLITIQLRNTTQGWSDRRHLLI